MSLLHGKGRGAAVGALALASAATGIYVAATDDPSLTGFGPAVIGLLLMVAAVVLSIRALRNSFSRRMARIVPFAGLVGAVVAALLIHMAALASPLFVQPADVPSVADPAAQPPYAAAVARAREIVRAAIREQNLPGVSVAVGAGGTIVWAEGFGWRDVESQTPVTPETRFNIGTAASAVTAATAASLGLKNTGTDTAADWSPSHLGEPEDDFPPFTFVHDVILRSLGVVDPAQPLPGDRATFYVPRFSDNDPRRGRRLMYMRDLACCPGRTARYSTPSDLVRFAIATNVDSLDAELAGGQVMSLLTRRDKEVVAAVASNVAYTDTATLVRSVAAAFAE
jgi:hypothetical protein